MVNLIRPREYEGDVRDTLRGMSQNGKCIRRLVDKYLRPSKKGGEVLQLSK